MKWQGEGSRILDFDIENRPLSYLGMDYTTAEITAIGWGWIEGDGLNGPYSVALTKKNTTYALLREFVKQWNRADIVTGHYILGHDIPIINGALTEAGLPILEDKLVQDTKVHLVKLKGISKSQENLGAMFGLGAPKVHMDTPKWREANRLTPDGIALTRERVEGDVVQHVELRDRLLAEGLLKPPAPWSAQAGGVVRAYTP